MKKALFTLLLFFSTIAIAQVNMWTYDTGNGGNNNGIIELSEAQACVDNESNITVSPSTTFNFSGQLAFDQISVQTIDFNGSKIEKNYTGDYVVSVNKASVSGTNTTILNLEIDGNNNYGSLLFATSRLNLTNVTIHHALNTTSSGEPRGIYLRTAPNSSSSPSIGARGEWLFDNVTIHDISNSYREFENCTPPNCTTQPSTGGAQGLYLYWPETVTGDGMQFVMINSEIYNVWGDEANGIIYNTQLNDISNTNNTLWFENVTIRDCERRAHKGFGGNQTWINSNIYAVDRTNPNIDTRTAPAGLFVIGAGSSSQGAENNLLCNVTFHAAPQTPFDAWENLVGFGGFYGPTGVELRNVTLESGDDINTSWSYDYSGMSLSYEISEFKLICSSIGAAFTTSRSRLNKSGSFNLVGGAKLELDSNNTYVDGQTQWLTEYSASDYIVSDMTSECTTCPTYGGITADITDIIFTQSGIDSVHVNENTVNPKWQMQPVTTETGESYSYSMEPGIDGAFFSIVNTDELQFNHTPDFENPLDDNQNNIYGCYVKVTSTSGNTFINNMGVFVQDVGEGGNAMPWAYCQDGNPIGGDTGYANIITSTDPSITHTISSFTTITAFKNFIEARTSGDVVFIDPSLSINLTGMRSETGEDCIYVPAGVTVASNRGDGGSLGAYIQKTDYYDTDVGGTLNNYGPIFLADGANVRITGIRMDGGHNIGPYPGTTWSAAIATVNHGDLEIDNCDITGFRHAAISLGYPTWIAGTSYPPSPRLSNIDIHHNNIHENNTRSLGYGVMVGHAEGTIYANRFYYNRHDIATLRSTVPYFDAFCNLIDATPEGYGGIQYNIDLHQTDGSTGNAHIHHNDIKDEGIHVSSGGHSLGTLHANIMPNGVPTSDVLVEYNRFALGPPPTTYTFPSSIMQRDAFGGTGIIYPYQNLTITGTNVYNGDPTGEEGSGGGVYVTSIAFDNDDQFIYVGQSVDNSHTFNGGPPSPTFPGVSYASNDPDIVATDGLSIAPGSTTYRIIADDKRNGNIENTMNVKTIAIKNKASIESTVTVPGTQIFIGN